MVKYLPTGWLPGWLGRLPMRFRMRFGLFIVFALTAIVACAGKAHAADRKYRTLYAFQGGTDGWFPVGVPAVDKDGNLYGTTQNGGSYDYGTIFKLTAPETQNGKWKKTVLHNFTGGNGGGHPFYMVFGPDGVLYGVAGADDIFSLAPPNPGRRAWRFQLLYTQGDSIAGNPVFDAAGNLYDVSAQGGDFGECESGCGVVFELERPQTRGGQWGYQQLYAFTGEPDGQYPAAGLTFDQRGNLWGTTWGGDL
jgi:uncharacterized repeat protein (TIGR03803 family)